jgi:hypothetical protein
LRTGREAGARIVAATIERSAEPVVFTLEPHPGYARRDRWLYIEVDKSSRDASRVAVDIPEEAMRFFENSVAQPIRGNAWTAYFQSVLRRRYALLLAQSLPNGEPQDERSRRYYELLARDFYGALGLAEGLLLNPAGVAPGAAAGYLDKAGQLMAADTPREQAARYFALRGIVRAKTRDHPGAIEDLETALSLWPVPDNAAIETLRAVYRDTGDRAALGGLEARVARIQGRRRY